MKVVYYLFKLFAALISLLPFGLLYFFSDILAFKLQYIFRYRRKVIFQNLHNSFPEKTDREINRIARRYYRNLSDVIFEVIKSNRLTRKQLAERMKFRNPRILNDLAEQGKSGIIAVGHCGNWEWMPKVLEHNSDYRIFGVVKPLSNQDFDEYITRLRKKDTVRNGELIPFKSTFRTLVKFRNELILTVMAADQTPTRSEIQHWVTFLNQDTPVFLGIERISKALDHAVLYFDIQRVKRGQYEITIHEIALEPKETREFEIVGNYMSMLENSIRQNPDNWLWSHRRWKHKKQIEDAETEKH